MTASTAHAMSQFKQVHRISADTAIPFFRCLLLVSLPVVEPIQNFVNAEGITGFSNYFFSVNPDLKPIGGKESLYSKFRHIRAPS